MPKLIVNTKGMAYEEWLKNRSKGLGGSDASAAVGVNPYKSPLVLYMEKRGLYKQEVKGEAAYWGNQLEDIVRKEFKKRYNEELAAEYEAEGINLYKLAHVQQRHALFAHDQHEFMRANIDGLIYCPKRGVGILECKTANQFLADEWAGDDVPNQYFVQVQHYMAVMDVNYAYIAVLIGGQRYKHYYIERDQEFIESLIAVEHNFWHNHILAKVPPVASGQDSENEMMKIMYPGSYDEPVVELPIEFREIAEKHESLKDEIKVMKVAQNECRNKIAFELKENAQAFAGPHQITFKANKNGVKSLKIKLFKREENE